METHKDIQENEQNIPGLSEEESRKAAQLIQRTYRGHRTRRQLNGFGLDASTRWYEAVRDAKYRKITTPSAPNTETKSSSPARSRWNQATQIAARAGADDESGSGSNVSISGSSTFSDAAEHSVTGEDEELRHKRAAAQEKRKRTAKMMDLQYFLEMVDQKHRYGSNLRKYHAYWKTQDTQQNYFYWLDQGDGKNVDLPECSRARLDREQVRYLSREERMNYLVKIDKNGQLIWAKNGEHVWTKDELYKDSMKGIVPVTDPTPAFKYNVPPPEGQDETSSESSSEGSGSEDSEKQNVREGERYVNEDFHRAKGPAKLKHVSAAVLFNHMVRDSMKKGHKWIFVADTSFRLYIGYKQSGSFQHSSFLYGARILSAGLIKVKDGQLRRLSPLSGHYRPPTANFRAFVEALREEGADMSRVSISRSYAVLVGLEGYVRTRRKVKAAEKTVTHEVDKVIRPEKARQDEEALQDKSKSAEKERHYLEKQRLTEAKNVADRKQSPRRLTSRISRAWDRMTSKSKPSNGEDAGQDRGVPGSGPEDGIPAPEGNR